MQLVHDLISFFTMSQNPVTTPVTSVKLKVTMWAKEE